EPLPRRDHGCGSLHWLAAWVARTHRGGRATKRAGTPGPPPRNWLCRFLRVSPRRRRGPTFLPPHPDTSDDVPVLVDVVEDDIPHVDVARVAGDDRPPRIGRRQQVVDGVPGVVGEVEGGPVVADVDGHRARAAAEAVLLEAVRRRAA